MRRASYGALATLPVVHNLNDEHIQTECFRSELNLVAPQVSNTAHSN